MNGKWIWNLLFVSTKVHTHIHESALVDGPAVCWSSSSCLCCSFNCLASWSRLRRRRRAACARSRLCASDKYKTWKFHIRQKKLFYGPVEHHCHFRHLSLSMLPPSLCQEDLCLHHLPPLPCHQGLCFRYLRLLYALAWEPEHSFSLTKKF